jgi:hypothetical protein
MKVKGYLKSGSSRAAEHDLYELALDMRTRHTAVPGDVAGVPTSD